MRIKIDDISKNTFTLPTPIDNREGKLKIGIRNIGYWVGFYNIYEEERCRWGRSGEPGTDFTIEPGLYNFKEISRDLRKAIKGLNLVLNKTSGIIDLHLPDGIILWIPEAVKYMLGLEDEGWLQGTYTGDRPVEFLPAGGISVYLDEMSTSNNFSTTKKNNIRNSNLLGTIPMLSENFGQFVSVHYDNPIFLDLAEGEINQLQFSLKLLWKNGKQDKLDNHTLPVSIELEII